MNAPDAQPASRRRLLAAGAGWIALAAWPRRVPAAGQHLPAAQSLAAELGRAIAAQRALVVMVSLDRCPFCRIVRENYLLPLAREGQPAVQLDLGSAQPLLDFQGAVTTHDRMARGLGARVAPTLLFFGAGGREAAPRLEGVPLLDFYGAYLHERVRAANRSLA